MHSWYRSSTQAIPAVVAFIELTYYGCNTNFGIALAATLGILSAMLALWGAPAGLLRISVNLLWPLAIWGLAVLWCVVPDLVLIALPSGAVPGFPFQRYMPDMLLPNLFRVLGLICALYAGCLVGMATGGLRSAVNWLIFLGLLNLLVGLVSRQIDPGVYWGRSLESFGTRYAGTMLNPNSTASFSGMVALLAWGRVLELSTKVRSSRSTRIYAHLAMALLASLTGISCCVITGARTAFVLTMLGMVLTTILLRKAMVRGMPVAIIIAFGTICGIFGFDGSASLLGSTGLNRMATIDPDAMVRLEIWKHYWSLVMQAPWFGYGLFSFTDTSLQSLHGIAEMRAFWYLNAAHNIVLELLMEGGWPYCILLMLGLVPIFRQIYRRWAKEAYSPLVASVMASLAVVAGVSMVDIVLNVPAMASLSAMLLGLLWGRALGSGQMTGCSMPAVRTGAS